MRISDDFIKEKVDDECVLVPIGEKYQHGIFELNETAERIYDLLCEGKGRDETVSAMLSEYDADISEVSACVDEFIGKLKEAGILTDD